MAELFGSEAGLSASTIQRLTREWSQEWAAFQQRDLSQVDYVYLWADGVHFNIRLEQDRLCCLVLVGVRADGHKELVAVTDGYRESTESWSELLRDLKRRGMRAPVLAIGDGALGFWGALREVFPESREQRCWVCAPRNDVILTCAAHHFSSPVRLLEIESSEVGPLAKRSQADRRRGEFALRSHGRTPRVLECHN